MVNYFYDCYCILNKVYSDKAFFKQAVNSTFIEEKNRAMTIKTCYGVLDKDIELSYYISKLCDKNPKLVVRTILKISMYAIKYMAKHDYAVIKNAVELVKKLGKGGMSGFVNAILRKFVKAEIQLPLDNLERISIQYSYPLFAVKELVKEYGEQRCIEIIKAENKKTCLRFFEVDGQKYLQDLGHSYEKTPFENVFLLDRFSRNEDYDKGVYTYQALGSVAICDMVEKCDNILDCCAAPGGKSIALSFKCKSVTSWDIHAHRVGLIEDYYTRVGVKNITASVCDSKEYIKDLDSTFDAVLCDAPCSGLGVVNDNPDIKLNRDEQNISELNIEQTAILDNVSKYVKVGGYLYYSTCSVLKKENLDIVHNFIKVHPNYEICKVESKLTCEIEEGCVKFLPDISNGLGFFFCKMKRVK